MNDTTVREMFTQSSALLAECAQQLAPCVVGMASALLGCFDRGGKVLLFGNGGSASQAQHFAAELINKLSVYRKPLPAIALTADTSAITSIANDLDFERVFVRQVEALARPEDAVWALSTSGNSPNVLLAVRAAQERNMTAMAFSGSSQSSLARMCPLTLTVPSVNTARIQEVHLCAGHAVCQLVESHYLAESGDGP